MSRPNVLLIHVDQHRADCLGAAGHPLIQTPALDRLAREGVHFTHAFTPIPVCTPARASLLTGTWPTTHGLIANADAEIHPPATLTLPTISQTLADAGYYVGHVGKWHVHPTLPPTAFGCHDYISDQGYAVWRREHGIPPPPRRNGFFGEADPYITPEQSSLAWGADRTIDLLRQAAQGDRPFFVRWDPGEPHLPNIVPEPYASLYPPACVTPWASFPDPLIGKPTIQHKQRATWRISGWTWHEWAPIVARYLGEITLLDHQVGRIVATLDELGLAGDTLVIYSSDHGDLCGGHGLIDKHFVMYDDLVRVPLIVRWPGVLPAGVTSDAFVCSSLDIAATIVAAAGCPLPATFAGLNLTEQVSASPRQDIFSTYYGNQLGLYSQRMVRDRGWKYVWNVVAEDELYDLADDPGEIRNRATDPARARELRRLRARMLAWLEQTDDRLLNTWTRRQLIDA
jgi:arylsulfatase A-like enzyme